MDYRIIKSPSAGTKEILKRRGATKDESLYNADAVGLVQGKMIDMIYASDIAYKAAGVVVEELRGNCPQHMLLIALYGDTSSVETAIYEIKEVFKRGV